MGLGYSSQEPVRISAKGKNERRIALHISFEVAEEESQAEPTPRSFVFDRLTSLTPWESVFNRLSISIQRKKRPPMYAGQHLIDSGLWALHRLLCNLRWKKVIHGTKTNLRYAASFPHVWSENWLWRLVWVVHLRQNDELSYTQIG